MLFRHSEKTHREMSSYATLQRTLSAGVVSARRATAALILGPNGLELIRASLHTSGKKVGKGGAQVEYGSSTFPITIASEEKKPHDTNVHLLCVIPIPGLAVVGGGS